MTDTDITPTLPAPGRMGQGTAVESYRAVAEVQAAIIVARQNPRNTQIAIAEMTETCKHMALAERAFYRYPRGGEQVSGATVHLARELARLWGNVQYGISELRRDDEFAQSEMLAWAWDVQTNTRTSSTFIVPHKRDTKTGVKVLADMRDIYENNTNNAARRVRECIFSILPPWFVEQAKDLCSRTLAGGGGVPRPQRVAQICRWYGETLNITVDQLEAKLGRESAQWTDPDLGTLNVIRKSIERGETTIDEEFPPPRVTAAEIVAAVEPPAPAPAAADPEWPTTAQPPDAPEATA